MHGFNIHLKSHHWTGKDIFININQRLQEWQPLSARLRTRETKSSTWASTTSIFHRLELTVHDSHPSFLFRIVCIAILLLCFSKRTIESIKVARMVFNELILHNMASKLILFSKQIFNLVPCFLWCSKSLEEKHKIPKYVNAHEVKGFI